MLQLYILCAELLFIFLSGLFGFLFIIYTYQHAKYKKTHYYRITHRPYLKMRRSTGSYGEYLIYNNLRSLEKEGRLLFNVYLPKEDGTTTEIDVLLIHKSGLYVFESKNYSGWIFGTESQRTWTQTLPSGRRSIKNRFFNPIMQNEGHISQLKQFLSDYPQIIYHSIILFSDRCELKKITLNQGKAAVMNRRRVTSFVKKTMANTNEVLDPNEIEAIDQTLFPYSQTSEEAKQIHIENIQAKHPKHSKKKSAGLKKKIEEQAAIETASTAECDPPAGEAQALEQAQMESAIQKQIKEDKEEYQMIPNTNTALDEQTKEAEKVCPRCGKPMVQRVAKRGTHSGEHFWGCSNFPKCRYMEKQHVVE